jgi:hypothetical protein
MLSKILFKSYFKFGAVAALVVLASACASTPEQATGRSLENAGSVVRTVGDKLLPDQSVENFAGKTLGNAGNAISTAADPNGGKIWSKSGEEEKK